LKELFKWLKKLSIIILIMVSLLFAIVLLIYWQVNAFTKPYRYSNYHDIPKTEAVLILGAKVLDNGKLCDILKDRVDTALDLYKNKLANKILVSGDHGTKNYDEVNAIKDYLLANGVSAFDIFLDHAGFNTYDSLYRARDIFKVKSLTITTQEFHLPRAVYIGKALGLEAYGLKADRHTFKDISKNYVREIPADFDSFIKIIFHTKPKFLGETIPITGDGHKSWDK